MILTSTAERPFEARREQVFDDLVANATYPRVLHPVWPIPGIRSAAFREGDSPVRCPGILPLFREDSRSGRAVSIACWTTRYVRDKLAVERYILKESGFSHSSLHSSGLKEQAGRRSLWMMPRLLN